MRSTLQCWRLHFLAAAVTLAVLVPTLSAGATRANPPSSVPTDGGGPPAAAAAASPLEQLLTPTTGPVAVPLTVTNPRGIARRGEPVTTGVPLPQGQVSDIDSLWLEHRSTGVPVPAQFAATSRWNAPPTDETASIKWVLVGLQSDVAPDGTTDYVLRSGGGSNPSAENAIIIDDGAGHLTVDTGPLRFALPKDGFGALFDGIWLDADNSGDHETVVAAPGSGTGVMVTRADGSTYRSDLDNNDNHLVAVESAGPLHAVFVLTGSHNTEADNGLCPRDYQGCIRDQLSHLEYTVRIHAYAGQPYLRIFYSVSNPERFSEGQYNSGGAPLFQEWDAYSLELGLNADGPVGYMLGAEAEDDHQYVGNKFGDNAAGSPILTGTLTGSETAELYQDSSGVENWQDSDDGYWGTTFRGYRTYNNGAVGEGDASGLQAAGWAVVDSGNAWRVGFGVRHFWQNFPKGLRIGGDGAVGVDLWPERWGSLHQLAGGRQKTHELVLGAWPGGTSDALLQDTMTAALDPMHLLAANDHYARSGALGPISIESDGSDPAFVRHQETSEAIVDNAGQDIWAERFVEDIYGWRNWGDSYRGGSKTGSARYFGNNEFDMTYVNLVNYLRHRDHDERLFEVAESQARQLYDIDVYHTAEDAIAYSHGVHKHDASGTVDHGRAPNLSHFWIRGLLDYYLLTGDRYALDAAEETGQWIDNLVDDSGELLYHGETRSQAWTLLALTELWETTGQQRYLTMAGALAEAEIISEQSLPGAVHPCPSLDWEGDRGRTDKPNAAPWQNGYVAEALGRYALAVRLTGDRNERAETALINVLDEIERCGWATPDNGRFTEADGTKDNDVYGERFQMLVIDRLLTNGDYSISFAVNQVLSDGFAYGYIFSGEQRHLAMADNTWTWTMGPERLPGVANSFPTYYATATPAKAAGFRQRFGHTYLWLRQALGSQPQPPEPPSPPTTQPPDTTSTTAPSTTVPSTTQPPDTPSTTTPSSTSTSSPWITWRGPRPTLPAPVPGPNPAPGPDPVPAPAPEPERIVIDFEDPDSLTWFRTPGGAEPAISRVGGNDGSVLGVSSNNTDRRLTLTSPDGSPVIGSEGVAVSADVRMAYYGSSQWGAVGSVHGLNLKTLPSGDAYVVSTFPNREGVSLRVGVADQGIAGFALYDFLSSSEGHTPALDQLVFEQRFDDGNRMVELGYWNLSAELTTTGDRIEIVATLTAPDGESVVVNWSDDGQAAYTGPGELGLTSHGLWSIQNRYDNYNVDLTAD